MEDSSIEKFKKKKTNKSKGKKIDDKEKEPMVKGSSYEGEMV